MSCKQKRELGKMDMLELQGYSGRVRELLERENINIGDEIEIISNGRRYRGILMARYELADPNYITLKLPNGYNIGIRVTENTTVSKISVGVRPTFVRPPKPQTLSDLPNVVIISTGGTIASRVEYRTGAVRPALDAEDLLAIVPELAEIAKIDTEVLYNVWSENIQVQHWIGMAEAIDRSIRKGVDGVVLTHGTDTMGYTAAALSFALQKPPIPIVLVGAQRSSDRPSSDAATNLIAAVATAAKAPFGEVVVAMHKWHSDDVIALHKGTRVVKLHTSSRDAFRSVNSRPIAYYQHGELKVVVNNLNPRGSNEYVFKPKFDTRAFLIKFFPSMKPDILNILADAGIKGFIIEGTGLGHVSSDWVPVIRGLTKRGIFVGMTSQCKFGKVNMNVYDSGRDLLKAGVIPLDDMLSEVALVKLMWTLGNLGEGAELEEIKNLMLKNIAGEIYSRSLPNVGL
ncbi:MAG: Glu-tRNA(Gln) amidotransferase subunit GatD [Thaumarchaeota archaeon]|nr:Glu-tRNA(Gln) amidotransferase subunit GatD [Candidatus Terraquivivens yellowstonensis]MCL7395355.1 Glu-tRNA(Gln) amidotransferase subunit GatD [Candidatus Terraquivivens yellowstonensis]MCL7398288.1 Glu-tRNA(Gln) amidotransferase subunit GatD [Candidatus Terraquivivens yellowstonensis]MCL7398753.1 Glu-tRNA(Gln) amidotransferase subunit GatD [Candidatus Terraquivivens yellowstonensis]MCL7400279.1 Glu-tRNA(Gln) amidotransferase subunit GatD [Candidatus Terraquivivens yellowstonensis]